MKTMIALACALFTLPQLSAADVFSTSSSVVVATCSSDRAMPDNSYYLQVIRGGYHLRTRLLISHSTFRGPVRGEYRVEQVDPDHRVGAPMTFVGDGVQLRIDSRLSRDGRLRGVLRFENADGTSRHTLGCVWGDGSVFF